MRARIAAAAVLAGLMGGVAATGASAGEGSFFSEMGTASSHGGGVVASGHREASLAGLEILDAGGNAVDAAVATMFAVGVADFGGCGIGGGGFMVYRSADGETAALDFREMSPSDPRYEFVDRIIVAGQPVERTGKGVVGVPGTVAGAAAALSRYGSMTFEAVLAPGERLARDGFTVQRSTAELIRSDLRRTMLYPQTARQYYPAGQAEALGFKHRLPDLADDYAELAQLGPRAFYDPELPGGTIADDLLFEMDLPPLYEGDDVKWVAEDLTGYAAKWRTPVTTKYRNTEFVGMPAPSSGGVAVAEMLNILQGFDLRAAGQTSADRFHYIAEAEKIAWADRDRYLADPEVHPTPAFLTSRSYADRRRSEISPTTAKTYDHGQAGVEGDNTHNIAVIDAAGNAVAINCSIEQELGSGVVALGTGFLLNNTLTDFEHRKGVPVDGHVNMPAPGKRPRSSQSPAIVVRGGKPVLVIGGVGGSNIITATLNAIVNVADFGQTVSQAIDAERGEARGACKDERKDGLQLCLEASPSRVPERVLAELRARGHDAKPWPSSCRGKRACEYRIGVNTHAAGFNRTTGRNEAATDPRTIAAGNVTTGHGAVAQPDRGRGG